jgi:hypothetical protein
MNGRAEKKIRDLQEIARTMLLHAKQRRPSAVTVNLWPYAMRMANKVSNFAPGILDGISPIEKFSQVEVAPRAKHSHTFGSPIYVLDNRLQTGKSIPRWNEKSRIGLYLGSSPRHSRKVALVLNLRTGHVSPQFHVMFDDLFETIQPSSGNALPASLWQVQTGFAEGKNTCTTRPTRAAPVIAPRDPEPGMIPEVELEPGPGYWPTDAQDEVDDGDWPADDWPTDDQEETVEVPPPPEPDQDPGRTTTRSGRVVIPTTRWTESVKQQRASIVALHVGSLP